MNRWGKEINENHESCRDDREIRRETLNILLFECLLGIFSNHLK